MGKREVGTVIWHQSRRPEYQVIHRLKSASRPGTIRWQERQSFGEVAAPHSRGVIAQASGPSVRPDVCGTVCVRLHSGL